LAVLDKRVRDAARVDPVCRRLMTVPGVGAIVAMTFRAVMMTRVAAWSSLKAWAMNVARRRGAKRAKVALARKLGVIMHRMWIDTTDFRTTSAAPA
jgi:transposase